jgi:hypothetical protein
MGICSKCKEEKELENRRYCEKCTKEIWRISNLNKLQKIKDIISNFKTKLGDKCQKCGEDRKHVLEFHHIDPSKKEDDIPTMLRYYGFGKSSIKQVEEEVDKCILLCSNCHRDFHYLERTDNITIKKYIN